MDAASRTGIDDIREIIEGVRYAPASARYKVYIIDEVHMLSKQAFNGLLKTLEEPPPHVKFIFATTEIRKVPVTVLSRCQRFDLRRIETPELAQHLKKIAEQEKVNIEDGALALIARAAEGSVRDGLSLLDQAIAHEEGTIDAESIRAMLGLADRGRILDLFEKTLGGRIAEALSDLRELYDRGADPLAIMQDLLETTHFLTRVKVAPGAEGFFDGGSAEAKRAAEMAAKLSVPSLTRAWQMLLKGLFEVRDATRPIAAAEMALIRLSYAADLPPTDKLVRDVMDGAGAPPARSTPTSSPSSGGGNARAQAVRVGESPASAQRAPEPTASVQSAPLIRSLEDIIALSNPNSELRVNLQNNVHLVRLEQGRLEFRPNEKASKSLAGDLAQLLTQKTGVRWVVSISKESGEPTLAEAKRLARDATFDRVRQEPLVRAVLDRFPGAEIVAVRDLVEEEIASPTEEDAS